jgi:hypothetical protein
MNDPIARKRLKKKMLDRWENEGGRITTETTSADASGSTTEDKGRGKKLSSKSDSSPGGKPATPAKTHKPTRK